jgi:hypothetical protein
MRYGAGSCRRLRENHCLPSRKVSKRISGLVSHDRSRGRVVTGRAIATDQTKNRTTVGIRLVVVMLMLVFVGALVFLALGPSWLYPRDASVRELQEHPLTYVGRKVNVVGYNVKHNAPHFGDDYTLCEGDPRNLYFAVNPCVTVLGQSSEIDRYLSLTYDGTNYEVVLSPCSFAVPCRVVISGVFIDRGAVTDASRYVFETSSLAWHE